MRAIVSILVVAIVAGCSGATGGTVPGSTPPGSSTSAADGTSAPTLSAAPTATAAAASAQAAVEVAPGITAWTDYTSAAYGITFGYPDGWTVDGAATRKWQEGDQPADGALYSDSFMNPESRDGDQIALGVWQMSGSGADVTSRDGLSAWLAAHTCDDKIDACETVSDVAVPMCLGESACLPAVLVPLSDSTQAAFADPKTGLVTIVSLGRPDSFPAAARYGGGVQLLKSILTTMDVWPPEPGQISTGS
jgi:hypothetical protein